MLVSQNFLQDTSKESLLYPSAQVYDWGSTLVVSPHPTTEVLGCGGAIALLRQMGYRVRVLFVGDGESSQEMGAPQKEDIRSRMEKVGISEDATTFLDLREGLIPLRGQPGFDEAARLFLNEMEIFQPDTVLFPFLDQGNQDIQATWQIVRQATGKSYYPVRMVEYRLWSWSTVNNHLEVSGKHSKSWRLDIKEVIEQKTKALDGFEYAEYQFPWRNPEQEILMHQTNPWEVYLEYTNQKIL